MTTARITVGGLEVNLRSSGMIGGSLPTSEGQHAAGLAREHSPAEGGNDLASPDVGCTQKPPCPLPPGPWRIVGVLAILGLILGVAVWLRQEQGRPH